MRRFRLGMILLGIAGSGCASPANPPTPPAEIPSLVVFPPSVTIDVGAITSASSEPPALVGAGGEFSVAISIGGDAARTIQEDVLEGLLSPFSLFEIPVDPAVTTFSGTITGDGPDVLPESFKFDFADFDFDGDGSKEGCTGCTCPTGCAPAATQCPSQAPAADVKRVCFRIWIQRDPGFPFERVMAGFFDLLPIPDDPATPADEENPGKGRFRTGVDRGGERFLVGVDYDHRNLDRPGDKKTDAFLLTEVTDEDGNAFTTTSHDLITEIDAAKTVQINFDASQSSDKPSENAVQLYSGRFRDDADFWSGSVVDTSSEAPLNLPTTCARLSTGNGAPTADCDDLGIDASDLDVTKGQAIRKVEEADVVFPADFPALPAF
ncbi:MAG TPA: hypothetical protein VFX30_02840 [bacterium]|nr:hypothetical protein [bacterium]